MRIFNNEETGAGNSNVKVYVGNAWDHTFNKLCSEINYFNNATYIVADCNLKGKFITVVVDSEVKTSLNICEVQAFVHPKHD